MALALLAGLGSTAFAAAAPASGVVDAGTGPVNPFARPEAEVAPAPLPGDATMSGRPELRGVIVAGANSIANLGGTLLAIGEERDGYRLERVTEEGATFRVRDQSVTLLLEPPAEDAPP